MSLRSKVDKYLVFIPLNLKNSSKVGKHLLSAVQTAYRFLLMEPDVFSRLWDWSCFLDLIQKLVNLGMGGDDKFARNISDIRWCGLQILSVILKMNDMTIANFGIGAQEAVGCLLRPLYLIYSPFFFYLMLIFITLSLFFHLLLDSIFKL